VTIHEEALYKVTFVDDLSSQTSIEIELHDLLRPIQSHTISNVSSTSCIFWQAVRNMPHDMTQYASAPANWQYLRTYSAGGTCSGMLAI